MPSVVFGMLSNRYISPSADELVEQSTLICKRRACTYTFLL